MSRTSKKIIEQDLYAADYYFNRELSWLEFNHRVLQEALDDQVPLLERLKFIGIFSANLDEFFMVRVAGLKEQVAAKVETRTPDGRTPQQQLESIRDRLHPIVQQQQQIFEQTLRPLMLDKGLYLLDYLDLTPEQRLYFQDYFEAQIFPVLTPLAVDSGHPFPHISNLSLNLAVVVKDADSGAEHFARVKVPGSLPRFLTLPADLTLQTLGPLARWSGIPLEQVIAHNLESLFPGMQIQECHPFRVTRNSDLDLEEDEADDLLQAIEQELRKRRLGGSAVRLEVQTSLSPPILQMLLEELELSAADIYAFDGIMGLRDVMGLLSLSLPDLKDIPWSPVVPAGFQRYGDSSAASPGAGFDVEESEDIFSVLRRRDVLLHHPYHSFSRTVQRFITQSAIDPSVLAIKMTLYRTSGDSPIIKALINAAENGKQVVALVELKARFDEANNISWARQLEDAGVHVVYGLMGLKTHTKITMVVRQEENRIRRYVHIGTGNYNPKTARLYTDLGLLSCREELGADLTDLFNYLTGYSRQRSYRHLLVAPVNMRGQMLRLIQQEIEAVQSGLEGRIVAKMNALVDPEIIRMLYRASQAGVKIDLIIRGVCCLKPGIPGVSDRIRVVSIVGRFLEHSRIFYFSNRGTPVVLIGSADWMPRNLNRRVEAIVPILDLKLVQDVEEILAVTLADNRQAWELQGDGSYVRVTGRENELPRSSQGLLMDMALREASVRMG
jgi:polyphosphate kinase